MGGPSTTIEARYKITDKKSGDLISTQNIISTGAAGITHSLNEFECVRESVRRAVQNNISQFLPLLKTPEYQAFFITDAVRKKMLNTANSFFDSGNITATQQTLKKIEHEDLSKLTPQERGEYEYLLGKVLANSEPGQDKTEAIKHLNYSWSLYGNVKGAVEEGNLRIQTGDVDKNWQSIRGAYLYFLWHASDEQKTQHPEAAQNIKQTEQYFHVAQAKRDKQEQADALKAKLDAQQLEKEEQLIALKAKLDAQQVTREAAVVEKSMADYQRFRVCAEETRNLTCINNAGDIAQAMGNIVDAKSWYSFAARYGDSNAISNLRRLGAPVPEPDLLREQLQAQVPQVKQVQQVQQAQHVQAEEPQEKHGLGFWGTLILGAVEVYSDRHAASSYSSFSGPDTHVQIYGSIPNQNKNYAAPSYKSSTGTSYQYDLSKPSDQNLYSIDPAAQLRDSINVNPRVNIDRSIGQIGGGVNQ